MIERGSTDGLAEFLSTPSARRATWDDRGTYRKAVFLSTPSARRATSGGVFYWDEKPISIHALREEGDGEATEGLLAAVRISIHALREEGDRPSPPPSAFP